MRLLQQASNLLNIVVGGRADIANRIPVDTAFLDTRLDEIDLGKGYTARFRHVLPDGGAYLGNGKSAPLVTVRDLCAMTEWELRRSPNMGGKTVARVKAMLAAHGLKFSERSW